MKIVAENVLVVSPRAEDAAALLHELSETLERITGCSGTASFQPDEIRPPLGSFFVAYSASGEPIGCGAYRRLDDETCEVKRMFANPGTSNVGRTILNAIENAAREAGYKRASLETSVVNRRAVDFYPGHGYVQIANFGKHAGRAEAVCFSKELV